MTLKIGFIGTGGIAAYHLRNLAKMDDADVVGFSDLVLERASKSAAEWPNARAYSHARDMFDDQKLDAVYICVPPTAHGEAENLTIERGIPFLVEKPLGLQYELPAAIAAKVAAAGLITSVGFHWRYSQTVQRAKELLRSQQAGMALGYWMGGMPGTPWWSQQHLSGGQFVEQTIHITDMLRYICGEVVEVYAAFSQQGSYPDKEVTIADVGTVTMKLANGMVATIANSCLLPVDGRVGLDIYTSKGILEVKYDLLTTTTTEGKTEFATDADGFYQEDEAFLQAVRTGDRSLVLCDYAEALKTHRVTMAANDSAVSGKPIRLHE